MKHKHIELKDLIHFIQADLIKIEGLVDGMYIDCIPDAEHVNAHSLDWVIPQVTNKQEVVENSKAQCLIVDEEICYSDRIQSQGKVLLYVKNPKRVLAEIGNHFFVDRPKPGIHPTAIISDDAQIGRDVYIGPYCIIGKAVIGEDCILGSHVRVYDGVIMGKCCNIKHGAVLGGEGFGFERDAEGNKFRFPQIGGLIIGDDVEIGANTCVDRGALSDTIIGDHTKINNLCHIAHNNKIGKNVTITGCVNISGSNVIEDDVWISPNASIRGYLHLGKGCILGMGAVAVKNIPENETWVGNPARKLEKCNG